MHNSTFIYLVTLFPFLFCQSAEGFFFLPRQETVARIWFWSSSCIFICVSCYSEDTQVHTWSISEDTQAHI